MVNRLSENCEIDYFAAIVSFAPSMSMSRCSI